MQPADKQGLTIQDGMVVSLEYTLQVEGKTVDSTAPEEMVQFIQGQGAIVPGLERQLYGMAAGERAQVHVSVEEGYGELDEDAVGSVPRSEFPQKIPLEIGILLQLRDEDGEVLDATIEAVGEDTISLDFNHPLAGKELLFDVHVVDLRPATQEELDHGHVHE